MKNFETVNTVGKISKGNEVVEIVKFNKVGTKRIFFAPMFNGNRITTTLFARMYDAERLAKSFLNR